MTKVFVKVTMSFLLCTVCSFVAIFLLPGQCSDDEEGFDRLVAASSESYVRI